MANEREMFESGIRSFEERLHKAETRAATSLAKLVQSDARIAVLETELAVAIAQLSTRDEDILFTPDFVIEEPCENPNPEDI